MKEFNIGRGYAYSLRYHIVWCVKRRRAILTDDIKKDLISVLEETAADHNVKLLKYDIKDDYVHIYIECKPQHYIPDIIKIFKGISGKWLLENHPFIRNVLWDKHLWDSNYFVTTENNEIDELIDEYINIQKKDSPTLTLA